MLRGGIEVDQLPRHRTPELQAAEPAAAQQSPVSQGISDLFTCLKRVVDLCD